jgi:glutamate 5-kinase
LNAQNTFNQLLDMGVIPIVNENDTLAVSEIKFGDNDTLSAITAAMIHADLLFLMTDVDCLYDKNPRTNPDAKAIEIVDDFSVLEADGRLQLPAFHRGLVYQTGLTSVQNSIKRRFFIGNWWHEHQDHRGQAGNAGWCYHDNYPVFKSGEHPRHRALPACTEGWQLVCI